MGKHTLTGQIKREGNFWLFSAKDINCKIVLIESYTFSFSYEINSKEMVNAPFPIIFLPSNFFSCSNSFKDINFFGRVYTLVSVLLNYSRLLFYYLLIQ